MTIEAIFIILLACMALAFVISVKIDLAVSAQDKCIEIDVTHYLQGPSHWAMVLHPFRWTFAQHYPELAKRAAE